MLYTPLTKKALALCFEAHRGQRDKSGMPYVFHPFHLAEQMDDEKAVCVALLHDVMEDTPKTAEDLRAAGMPEDVLEALCLLTHDPAEPYREYVARAAENPLARRVKRADLLHNSDLNRLDEVDAAALARVAKYAAALAQLEGRPSGMPIFGAVVGDVVGSVYEFRNIKTTEFPLFSSESTFTDDSVMTIAVADALLSVAKGDAFSKAHPLDRAFLGQASVAAMKMHGRRHPDAGFGGRFRKWLRTPEPKPYGSWGNGSAMRVSPVAWAAGSVEEAELLAAETAQVTHNHPEGIKGAQAVAACVFLARAGYDNSEMEAYVRRNYGYDLGFTLDSIRATYTFDVSCQGSVPQAIVAFLESTGFEDAVRRAVSIGGDSDTIAAIAGAIAQARYGVPEDMAFEARRRLTDDLLEPLDRFWEAVG